MEKYRIVGPTRTAQFHHGWTTIYPSAGGDELNERRHGPTQTCSGIPFGPACDGFCSNWTLHGVAALPSRIRSPAPWNHPCSSCGSPVLPCPSFLREFSSVIPSSNVFHEFNLWFPLHTRGVDVPKEMLSWTLTLPWMHHSIRIFSFSLDALARCGCVFLRVCFGSEWVLLLLFFLPWLFTLGCTCWTWTVWVTSTSMGVRWWRERRRMS